MNNEAYKKEKVFSTSQLNKKYNTKVSNLFFNWSKLFWKPTCNCCDGLVKIMTERKTSQVKVNLFSYHLLKYYRRDTLKGYA